MAKSIKRYRSRFEKSAKIWQAPSIITDFCLHLHLSRVKMVMCSYEGLDSLPTCCLNLLFTANTLSHILIHTHTHISMHKHAHKQADAQGSICIYTCMHAHTHTLVFQQPMQHVFPANSQHRVKSPGRSMGIIELETELNYYAAGYGLCPFPK